MDTLLTRGKQFKVLPGEILGLFLWKAGPTPSGIRFVGTTPKLRKAPLELAYSRKDRHHNE